MYIGGTRNRAETRFLREGIRSLSDSIRLSTRSGKTNSGYASTRDYCDSSDCDVGAVLTQQDNCGFERPISFISQKLTDTQQRWATIEKEAYAIVSALTKLREVIIGSKIYIFTDHNPLTYLTESTSKSAKLVRWSLALQTFDVDVKYTKGKLNVVADCLSRL